MRRYQGKYIKYFFDKCFSLAALAVSSPLMIVIAAAILIEGILSPERRGPIFVRLPRVSRRRRFSLLKFRKFIQASGENQNIGEDGPAFTYVGFVLHLFRLDGLPQLWNILVGNISFIGPRPASPHEYELHPGEHNNAKIYLLAGLFGPGRGHMTRKEKTSIADSEEEYYFQIHRGRSHIELLMEDMSCFGRTILGMNRFEENIGDEYNY